MLSSMTSVCKESDKVSESPLIARYIRGLFYSFEQAVPYMKSNVSNGRLAVGVASAAYSVRHGICPDPSGRHAGQAQLPNVASIRRTISISLGRTLSVRNFASSLKAGPPQLMAMAGSPPPG